jgi:DNA-binding transcriptional MerR regulator
MRHTGLSEKTVYESLERQLVREPLVRGDLVQLRRIRRLQELGVNMAGIEAILHMRQQIRALRYELRRRGQMSLGQDVEPSAPWQRLLPLVQEEEKP